MYPLTTPLFNTSQYLAMRLNCNFFRKIMKIREISHIFGVIYLAPIIFRASSNVL